jgi:hypothetical protein
MKAMPVRVVLGRREMCAVGDATHVIINLPGPTGLLALPVILKGTRDGTICWTWNGDTELPTLRPSVLNQRKDDSNNEHTGKTLDLLDVPDSERGGEE